MLLCSCSATRKELSPAKSDTMRHAISVEIRHDTLKDTTWIKSIIHKDTIANVEKYYTTIIKTRVSAAAAAQEKKDTTTTILAAPKSSEETPNKPKWYLYAFLFFAACGSEYLIFRYFRKGRGT